MTKEIAVLLMEAGNMTIVWPDGFALYWNCGWSWGEDVFTGFGGRNWKLGHKDLE